MQDLRIEAHNTRYQLERWVTPDGQTLRGELPAALDGGHFGPTLRAFVLYQYHQTHVTQPLLRAQQLPQALLAKLAALEPSVVADHCAWQATLEHMAITDPRHVRIATEGALLAAVLACGINPELVIVSDDAGQSDVLTHALCWIHAERNIDKLIAFNDDQRAALDWARGELWALYQALKVYQAEPSAARQSMPASRRCAPPGPVSRASIAHSSGERKRTL